MSLKISAQSGGVKIGVKVVPGASRDRIVGPLGESLKIAVSKPPQDGAANRAVIAILSSQLGMPEAQVQIVQGHSSPRKQVLISGITAEQLIARLGLH
jgi:uncharacterized protein (TIGR00251 family)